MVSTFAFLASAYDQCEIAGSSLGWGLLCYICTHLRSWVPFLVTEFQNKPLELYSRHFFVRDSKREQNSGILIWQSFSIACSCANLRFDDWRKIGPSREAVRCMPTPILSSQILSVYCVANNIIIITAFKGAIQDFYNFLIEPRTVSNTCAQVARTQSCENQVQHIQRLSLATCRVTCHVVRRDSSAIKLDRV